MIAGPRVAMLPPEPLTDVGVDAVGAAVGAGVLPPLPGEDEDEDAGGKPAFCAGSLPPPTSCCRVGSRVSALACSSQ